MGPVSESGRLQDHSLPRLLLALYAERFTGGLSLERARVAKRILFHEGVPILAESNLSSETLGVQLLDTGKLSRKSYAKVVGYVQLKKCKEGQALLDLELLGAKDLFHELKEQVRRRLLECFSWPDGTFALDRSCTPPPNTQPFRTNPVQLIQEGIEAHWRPDRVLSDLEDQLQRYPHPTDRLQGAVRRLLASDALGAFVAAADGRCTLWSALQQAGSPPPLAIAWVLDAMGGFTYADEPKPDGDATQVAPDIEVVIVGSERGVAARADAPAAAAPDETVRAESKATRAMREEILRKFEQIEELNNYQILELDPDAKAGAIKRAYVQAAKRYHPDALTHLGLDDETKAAANDVFARIAKAHAVLGNAKRRREYDALLTDGTDDAEAERVARAETNYRKGEVLLRKGDFRGATEFLRGAVEIWPNEVVYQSAYAWALLKKVPSEPEKAREHLINAIDLDSRDAVAHHRLSVVLRVLGEEDAANDAVALAKQLDPSVG